MVGVIGALLILGIAALFILKLLRVPALTLAAAGAAMVIGGSASTLLDPLHDRPLQPARTGVPPRSLAAERQAFTGQFTPSENWLRMADALASRGNTEDAAALLIASTREHPRDYSLWVGLGNALVDHSGALTPGSRLAFRRAQELAPGYPAPRYFLGLAELRSGNPEEARRLWTDMLANAPAEASWRPLVENAVLAIQSPQAGS